VKKTNLMIVAKALLFLAIFEVLLYGIGFAFPSPPKWALGITAGGGMTVAMLLLTRAFLKSEKLTMSDLGMTYGEASLQRFFLSLCAGMALFACFFLVYVWLSPVEVSGVSDLNLFNAIVISFLAILLLAAMEEVVFRGYLLKKLETAFGIRFSIYATSIAFGLYHGLNLESFVGPAIWGLLFGTLAFWSKGLAIPIGFHAGVNLTQALFSQKERWASGIWTVDLTQEATPFTVDQITFALMICLLVAGIVLVEVFLRKNARQSSVNDSLA
jgi:membrane protease YdiL (CAAX protease family)